MLLFFSGLLYIAKGDMKGRTNTVITPVSLPIPRFDPGQQEKMSQWSGEQSVVEYGDLQVKYNISSTKI